MGLQTLRAEDSDRWMTVLKQSFQHDFHHLPHYHRVAEQHGEGAAHLFVYREEHYMIALPLLLRSVEQTRCLDATSVYGYCGPIASHEETPEAVVGNFQIRLKEALMERRVVAAFSRLHPLISQDRLLAGLGECRINGQTVSIDLTLSPDEQWLRYNKSCRRSLKKLRESGFVAFRDEDKRYLKEFADIYHETMRRRGAQSYYHFDEDYFRLLSEQLGSALQLFVALSGSTLAAASLATISGGIMQDFLGGTRSEFLALSPDRLVVDVERGWAQEMGARVLHIGGGVGSNHDSLFRYKAGFSDRRHTFSTWRCILDPGTYHELCEAKARSDVTNNMRLVSENYFPAYRCAAAPASEPFGTSFTTTKFEE